MMLVLVARYGMLAVTDVGTFELQILTALLLGRTDLLKDQIHNPTREQYLSIWYRHWGIGCDRLIERFDQVFHTRLHMEIPRQKQTGVLRQVCHVLFRENNWRNELFCIALVALASKADQRLLVLVENKAILCSVETKLVQ